MSGCRKNVRSTHWLGEKYARLPHTGSGVVSAMRLSNAVIPSGKMIQPPPRRPRNNDNNDDNIAPPAMVAPPAGDGGRPAQDKRTLQIQGAEKRPATIYSGRRPTWSFDRWQFDRTERDDDEKDMWSLPDRRLAWMVENEGFGVTKREEPRTPSNHLIETNYNPYGYMKLNNLPFISDQLTIDFRPYTPYTENDNVMERRTAYLQQAFETFKRITNVEDLIKNRYVEKGMVNAWTSAIMIAVDSITHDDTNLYGSILNDVYSAFPDQNKKSGPFYESYYKSDLPLMPFDLFVVHAVTCTITHAQYDRDELYDPVDMPADYNGPARDVAGEPMEAYNDARTYLTFADAIVSNLMKEIGGARWYPDIVDLLLGGTYVNGDNAAAIMLEFYMSIGTDEGTPEDLIQ